MDILNSRSDPRFVIDDPIAGYFGRIDVAVHDISASGLQIGHAEPLKPGLRGRLGFRLPEFSVAVSAAVVWCRMWKGDDRSGIHYRSGLRLDPAEARLTETINKLASLRRIRPDDDSMDRKRQKTEERNAPKPQANPMMRVIPQRQGVSSDQLLLIQQARERLRASPTDAAAWIAKGRAAMATESTRLRELELPCDEQVFAVWEYLDRSIDLVTLARAFAMK